jgi:hypothetical protein
MCKADGPVSAAAAELLCIHQQQERSIGHVPQTAPAGASKDEATTHKSAESSSALVAVLEAHHLNAWLVPTACCMCLMLHVETDPCCRSAAAALSTTCSVLKRVTLASLTSRCPWCTTQSPSG